MTASVTEGVLIPSAEVTVLRMKASRVWATAIIRKEGENSRALVTVDFYGTHVHAELSCNEGEADALIHSSDFDPMVEVKWSPQGFVITMVRSSCMSTWRRTSGIDET